MTKKKGSPAVVAAPVKTDKVSARPKIEAKSDKVTKFGSIGYTVRMREKRYEPGMTAASQNIPTSLAECRQWLRHFYLYEPYFGQLIDFFAEFPQTGVHPTHPDPAINAEYEALNELIDIDTYLKDVFFEYFLIGDVFPFVFIDKDSGEVNETTLLNPDDVEVKRVVVSDKEQIYIRPPQELKEVVSTRKPKELYDRLSADQRKYIRAGENIPLNPMQADHLKRGNSRYSLTGAPAGFRIFRALIQRDKLRDAQWIMADRFTTPVRIFSLLPASADMRHATAQDVLAFTSMLEMADDDPSQVVISNFNVQAQLLGTSGQWGHVYQDINAIVDEFLVAFGVNRAILTGEGVTYANASVGLDRLIRQFATAQRLVARMIKRLVYDPYAKLHGFVDKDGKSAPATLEFDKLVNDEAVKQTLFKGLRSMEPPMISAKTTLNAFGLDSETEASQIKQERGSVFDPDGKSDSSVGGGDFSDDYLPQGGGDQGGEEGGDGETPVEEGPIEEAPTPITERQQSRKAAKLIAELAATLSVDELNDALEKHKYGIVAL